MSALQWVVRSSTSAAARKSRPTSGAVRPCTTLCAERLVRPARAFDSGGKTGPQAVASRRQFGPAECLGPDPARLEVSCRRSRKVTAHRERGVEFAQLCDAVARL